MKADLHNHTTYSDGVLSVLELAQFKKQEGFDCIAITDHDSIGAFQDITKDLPIPVLVGVELSTYYHGENIHLLGYFKGNQLPTDAFQKFLTHLVEKRKTRVMKMIRLLKKQGIEIRYEDVLKFADGAVARPHVAKAIQEKYPLSWEEIFHQYIGEEAPCYVKTENLDLKDAITLLHQNHALAVLAHPHYIQKNEVKELIKLGIDGIEVYYATMNEQDRKKYLQLAKDNHLLVTGGSDFHEALEKSKEFDSYGLQGEDALRFLNEVEVKINDWK